MGTNGAEFQAALTNICRIFVSGNSKLLWTLTRDSDHLRLLSELYLPISQNFKTVFFYEEYKTPLVGGMSMMVKYLLYCDVAFVDSATRLYLRPWLLFVVLSMLMPFHFTNTTLTW